MSNVTNRITIQRSIEDVFAVLTDVEQTGTWFPGDVEEHWTSPTPRGVGSTGAEGAVSDFTALGDVVNTTARLAAEAGPGELLISIDAVQAAEVDAAGLEHRTVAVRGRSDPIEVVADRPPPGARASTELS